MKQETWVFISLYQSEMQPDLGEVTLHAAEAAPELLTLEGCPPQLREGLHSFLFLEGVGKPILLSIIMLYNI